MRFVVRMKGEFELVKSLQDFESLRLVVLEALGGSSQSAPPPKVQPIGSFAELASAFSAFGGKVG